MNFKIKDLLNSLTVLLAVAELLLVLISWLLSATMTDNVRSLLSSEGVRWFFSNFTQMLASPRLVWLLLLSMAAGCLVQSGLHPSPFTLHPSPFRQRVAMRTAIALLAAYAAIVIALAAVPHAVLLSATGHLFPSPFSRALVPVVSFGVLIASAAYGWTSGRFTSLADIIGSMSFGIGKAAPLFILYILLTQLYNSLLFVFM